MKENFESIILVGRPAAGKSEVIDYLKKTDIEQRQKRFHIGEFEEIDDFPYIWSWFEEDDILEKHGKERFHTDSKYYFKDEFMWDLCIEKINLAFNKRLAEDPSILSKKTLFVEFARGGENAFAHALSILSDDVLKRSGVVYIKVSYEESCRKNRRRARKGLEGSILFHSLPDDKMEFYYKTNDWDKIAPDMQGFIDVKGVKVPYAVFPNEPEVTDKPDELARALDDVFRRLWKKFNEK
jgi:hypothetical protein